MTSPPERAEESAEEMAKDLLDAVGDRSGLDYREDMAYLAAAVREDRARTLEAAAERFEAERDKAYPEPTADQDEAMLGYVASALRAEAARVRNEYPSQPAAGKPTETQP